MGAVEIAHALAASRRSVRLYPPEHPTRRAAIATLTAAVREAVDIRPLTLNTQKGRLYEASDVITDASPPTRALIEAMESRRVESMTFHIGFADLDANGLSEVMSLRPTPELEVHTELEERGVKAVTVSEIEDNSMAEASEWDRRREADRAFYRHALNAFNEITAALAEPGAVETAPALRALGSLMERVTQQPSAILALAMNAGRGDILPLHSASVMLRALVLGHAAGLEERALMALGVAALLHDTGRTVTGAPEHHSVAGAQMLGSLLDDDAFAMLVAYEHHMGVDGSGEPAREAGYVAHPYSRVTSVVDRYDELTRPSEDGTAIRPDEAVFHLLEEATEGPLDPVFARLFVQCAGVFPVGTVVRLSDMSVALVHEPGRDPLRPRVLLVLGHDGAELRPALHVDLSEDERSIVEPLDASLIGLQPAEYL
jgi:HD-GYP domain-containing protein (c-di-GMP phosphodiesterase class II)